MNKRPYPVTVIACLLIAAGVFGLSLHVKELASQKFFHWADLWVPMVGFLPAVLGVFILLGRNWARWIALVWMAFHVAISFLDSLQKVAVHFVLFLLIAYALFHADARAYFRPQKGAGT